MTEERSIGHSIFRDGVYILSIAGILGLLFVAIDRKNVMANTLYEKQRDCVQTLNLLSGELGKRVTIVQLKLAHDDELTRQRAIDSDISAAGAWNAASSACVSQSLIDEEDPIYAAMAEARDKSLRRLSDPVIESSEADMTGAEGWSRFAIRQVNGIRLDGWWVFTYGWDRPNHSYKFGDT